jgi:uncharacterized RDD family membrane protein YckC
MQEPNLYSAPGANLDGPSRKDVEDATQIRYAGFWQRFGAYWIDVIVLLPLMGLGYWGGEQSRLFQLYWLVPGLLFGLFFSVYLVKRYGGTPGKLLLNTRIAMLDGSAVTMKAAVIRHAVLFILSALMAVAMVMATLKMTDASYFSLGYLARAMALTQLAPAWYSPVMIFMQIWVWGEFITMLFNKRRRAVHDFIAGTIVVRT